MRVIPRTPGILILLALFASAAITTAQGEPPTVVGSGVVAPAFEILAEAAGIELAVNVTGTNSGFEAFCGGRADIALATRPISVEEEAACLAGGVNFSELLLGHSMIAFVAGGEDVPECLNNADLDRLFAPSSEGQVTNWNQVNPAFPDLPLSIYAPAPDTRAFALLDSVIDGVGIRTDVSGEASEEVLAAVSADSGAIGVFDYALVAGAESAPRTLEIDAGTGAGCAAPSAENVENRLYPAADRLFAYVNTAALDDETTRTLIEFAIGDEAASVVTAAGFVPPTEAAYATNREVVETMQSGRAFSREVTDFTIPDQVFGQVSVAGSPGLNDYFSSLQTTFNTQYPSVTINAQFAGHPTGFERLCNGEADLVVAFAAPNDEQQAACDSSNVTLVELPLATEAVVLVATEGSEFLACLTTEQLATIWGVGDDAPTTWNEVSADFPEAPLFLFGPTEMDSDADLLMAAISGQALPMRSDMAEANNDPLYRAAATANAESGLTFMGWSDYQEVEASDQAGIQLVAVDAGEGCVTPDERPIANGSYPLSRAYTVYVSQQALARPEVQSFLWLMASDDNYALFAEADVVGMGFDRLPDVRARLQEAFRVAVEQAAIAAEATPEATLEATEEATAEATEAATEAATEES